jgi:SagB-type dehydrogenase family enzyme
VSALPTLALHSTVYGSADVELDDPAEHYHEASKLYPALAAHQGAGIARLVASPLLLEASRRPGRRNGQLPAVALPPPKLPRTRLRAALHDRRSAPPPASGALALPALGAILAAGYGSSAPGRRSVPSGGALYPLEVYVTAARVEGLPCGVFHLDPLRHVLEVQQEASVAEALAAASPLPGLMSEAAAVLFITAVFWRTRFKYGLRGYRFALLEAGHAMQNVLLAATALRVPALPLGGYYDAQVEELLGVDGVDESVVYAAALGGGPC